MSVLFEHYVLKLFVCQHLKHKSFLCVFNESYFLHIKKKLLVFQSIISKIGLYYVVLKKKVKIFFPRVLFDVFQWRNLNSFALSVTLVRCDTPIEMHFLVYVK